MSGKTGKTNILVDEMEIIHEIAIGDVTKDKLVSGADVVYLASHVAGIEGYEIVDKYTADINNDGNVNGTDVVYLASYVAGIEGFNIPKKEEIVKKTDFTFVSNSYKILPNENIIKFTIKNIGNKIRDIGMEGYDDFQIDIHLVQAKINDEYVLFTDYDFNLGDDSWLDGSKAFFDHNYLQPNEQIEVIIRFKKNTSQYTNIENFLIALDPVNVIDELDENNNKIIFDNPFYDKG